ncbi:hypothetical protein D3C78_1325440 [compost metagenome]
MLIRQLVLPLAPLEVLSRVDEQHIVRLFALLQHQDTDWDACGEKQIGWQADHCVDVAILEQLGTDASLSTASEQHTMRKNDGHHAILFEEMEAMQQKSKVRC